MSDLVRFSKEKTFNMTITDKELYKLVKLRMYHLISELISCNTFYVTDLRYGINMLLFEEQMNN